MKPLIIYVRDDGGTFKFTRAELEKIINDAYEQGKADASHTISGTICTVVPGYTPEHYYDTGITTAHNT